ncbi:MAG: thiamine pyrophosphate-dependent dehydrogenase E1 component subunit alpha, partial [Flavitalea sp.]
MENTSNNQSLVSEKLSFDRFRQEVLKDYKMACESREASLLGRKEVLTGKAKFGIFGDGKEVAQIAAAKFFRPGDFLSGYYRDQTFAFALGEASIEDFFSQLYADPNPVNEPHSGGRQMNSHFSTPYVTPDGEWLDLVNRKNIASPMAPTAAQMPRSVGFAFASKVFRESPQLTDIEHLSDNGNEICFCTIGDASTSEGHFWEAVNAAGVLQIPLAIFVWDDGYGISVPRKYQTTKGSISEALRGMQKRDNTNGVDIYRVKAWDYAGMCEVFDEALARMRETHVPAVFHVEEVTQPQGHSTSGSHERYKTPERLEWERAWDGNKKMREWLIENALANEDEIERIETNAKTHVKKSRQQAWDNYINPIKELINRLLGLFDDLISSGGDLRGKIASTRAAIAATREPTRKDMMRAIHGVLLI